MNSRVLVTGATGFVGRAVVSRLSREGHVVRAASRSAVDIEGGMERIASPDLHKGQGADWTEAVRGVTTIVHAAARVHVMRDRAADPLAEFRRANRDGTLALARAAAQAGVRRLVFVSSIKVNGESTPIDRPFAADDVPAPIDPYGISKHEAEEQLKKLSQDTGMELVVVRPVLVYGPGVRANFRAMMQFIARGIPLPFAAIHNARSLVGIENLVDLLATVVRHPAAANQTFLVSDGLDLSTPDLVLRTAAAMRRRARLFPVPPRVLMTLATIAGRRSVAQRLVGSLRVSIDKTSAVLGWNPTTPIDKGLETTAAAFLKECEA